MRDLRIYAGVYLSLLLFACGKGSSPTPAPPVPPVTTSFSFNTLRVDGTYTGYTYVDVKNTPVIKLSFLAALDKSTVAAAITLKDKAGTAIPYTATYENADSTVIVSPTLGYISKYTLSVATGLKSTKGGYLQSGIDVSLVTAIDANDKFPTISDDALLDAGAKQTVKYFYDFGHPTSGLARERNTSGDVVTTGGSGFGIMGYGGRSKSWLHHSCRWFGAYAKDSRLFKNQGGYLPWRFPALAKRRNRRCATLQQFR
jgi:hypothetical protein